MKRALTVAGMCHVCSNMADDIHTRLDAWPEFYPKLKNVESFLANRETRDLFYHELIRDTRYDTTTAKDLFSKEIPRLYEQRWARVMLFLKHVGPILAIMRGVWNMDVWKRVAHRPDRNDDSGVDLEMLSQTLASNWFFAYKSMITRVQDVLMGVSGVTESCHCHEHLRLPQGARAWNIQDMRNEFEAIDEWTDCPCK
eukprot:14884470-Alexandrium_andersonii.AAC.1